MKKMKWLMSSITFLFVAGMLYQSVFASELVEGLSLSKSSVEVKVGKTIKVKSKGKANVKVLLPGNVNKKIEVTTSDSSIIRVSKTSDFEYRIKALKTGKAKVLISNQEGSKFYKELNIKVVKKIKKKKKKEGKLTLLTTKNFEKEVVNAKGRVVIMFGTTWCHYCKLLDPIYEKVAKKDTKASYLKVDADKEEEISVLFGVINVPRIFLLENNKTIDVGGYISKWKVDDYIRWIHEEKPKR